MTTAIFDLETDGLLEEVTTVHVMAVRCLGTGTLRVFRQHQMQEGLSYLATFDLLVGHNITKYDLPVLGKLFGYTRHWSSYRDTLTLSRLIWADIVKFDLQQVEKKLFPSNMIGRHSLEAWGRRLGSFKGDYAGDPSIADEALREASKWLKWNQAMEDYCVQDVEVTASIWAAIQRQEWAEESTKLESQVAHIVARQERYGFLFDEKAAVSLYGELVQRRMVIERTLKDVFRPRLLRDGKVFVPKRDSKTLHYVAGAPFQKLKWTEFNPASRNHVAIWLKALRGWDPVDFTAAGDIKVDDEILGKLPYPEAKPLAEYFMVVKRIGQIAEGDEAWLKHVRKTGRIHGGVNSGGAVTGRMTHSRPNLGQVPAAYSPYGPQCRACFTVPKGKRLIGCDADALELRDLAGYMAYYDKGIYIEAVLNGSKKDGTDTHSMNARALGLDPKAIYFDGESGRDIAKTWFYAFIYGAGDEKLGYILLRKRGPAARKRGKQAREDFLKNLPAMGGLVRDVKSRAKSQGWLRGLDGRRIPVRGEHASLNTLLQSAGAVQMKRALCILDDDLQAIGLVPGTHYEFVANVHDEWQIEVNDELVETIGPMAALAIRKAGEYYSFACPLAGDWKHGVNWYETH